jgi:hypothetical protein
MIESKEEGEGVQVLYYNVPLELSEEVEEEYEEETP